MFISIVCMDSLMSLHRSRKSGGNIYGCFKVQHMATNMYNVDQDSLMHINDYRLANPGQILNYYKFRCCGCVKVLNLELSAS